MLLVALGDETDTRFLRSFSDGFIMGFLGVELLFMLVRIGAVFNMAVAQFSTGVVDAVSPNWCSLLFHMALSSG